MLKTEMLKEIEGLRAQLDQLKAQSEKEKKQQSSDNAADQDDERTDTQENAQESTEDDQREDVDISLKIQQLIKTVDEELKEASPITVLVVFAVGVFMGRLLPK